MRGGSNFGDTTHWNLLSERYWFLFSSYNTAGRQLTSSSELLFFSAHGLRQLGL